MLPLTRLAVTALLVLGSASSLGCNRRFKPSPAEVFAEDVALAGRSGVARVRTGAVRPFGEALGPLATLLPARAVTLRGDGTVCIAARDGAEVSCLSRAAKGPQAIAGLGEVSAFASGRDSTCAVIKGDGSVTCFPGTTAPAPVVFEGQRLVGARALGAFGARACAVDGQGAVLCWPLSAGVPERVAALPAASSIGVGEAHACASTEDERAFCWGRNREGQLGDGTFEDRVVPVEVLGLGRVKQLALGARFSCALTADATVRCWGDNGSHQLADGTTTAASHPHMLLGLFEVFQLVAGEASACARMGNGDLRCWGALRVPGTEADELSVPTNVRFAAAR